MRAHQDRRERQQRESRSAVNNLGRFCRQVSQGLDTMTFEEKQLLLRLVVERVTVEDGHVRVDALISAPRNGQSRDRLGEPIEARQRRCPTPTQPRAPL